MCADSYPSNSSFVGVIYMYIIALSAQSLAPNNKLKEALVHIRLILSTITKNVLNRTHSADPGETPRFVASHLGLCYLQMLPVWNHLHKCINHIPIIAFVEF